MKKAIVLSLTLSLVLGMTGCAKTENAPAAESTVEAVTEASSAVPEETTAAASEEASTETTAAAGTEGVLSYAEYMAAELDSEAVMVGRQGYRIYPGSGRRLFRVQYGLLRGRL